jgi:uncharacterized protein YceH (UPF0502 family)
MGKIKLSDMGTAGLVDRLKTTRKEKNNRYYHLLKGKVRKIIEARYPKTDKAGYNVAWSRFCNCL